MRTIDSEKNIYMGLRRENALFMNELKTTERFMETAVDPQNTRENAFSLCDSFITKSSTSESATTDRMYRPTLRGIFAAVLIALLLFSAFRWSAEAATTKTKLLSEDHNKKSRGKEKQQLRAGKKENVQEAPKPYNLVVVSTFKNESILLGEWIQHYVNEGVDHFYLLDNGSPDDYMKLVQHFPTDMVTVVRDGSKPRVGLQDQLMNKYFTSTIISEANWVLVVDVDEYVYPAKPTMCIADVLSSLPSKAKRIWMPWKVFGSNGHLKQPKIGVVGGFTKRAPVNITMNRNFVGYGKSVVRVGKDLHLLTHGSTLGEVGFHYSNGTAVHHAPGITRVGAHIFDDADNAYLPLQLNHYMFQSREYYETVKCVRGGGQSGLVKKYTMRYYDGYEPGANAEEDRGLAERYAKRKKICKSALVLLEE